MSDKNGLNIYFKSNPNKFFVQKCNDTSSVIIHGKFWKLLNKDERCIIWTKSMENNETTPGEAMNDTVLGEKEEEQRTNA